MAGHKRALEQSVEDRKATGRERKKVQKLISEGSSALGSMDYYLFAQEAQKRLNTELPDVLSAFEMKRASVLLGPAMSALMEYMTGCFVKYEVEIHRLNKTIDRLKRENKALRGGSDSHASAAASEVSEGRSSTLGEWKERTLRTHSKTFKAAMEKESGNCPVKAIALAAEVLRRLEGPNNLSKENLVNKSIVTSLKDFYSEVSPPLITIPPPPPPHPTPSLNSRCPTHPFILPVA
jgi:hypothetical protein